MGDKIADENFKWDNLNGRCLYFNNQGLLEREESWLAKNPDKPFDTIDVPDPKNPNLFEKVVVQIEGSVCAAWHLEVLRSTIWTGI